MGKGVIYEYLYIYICMYLSDGGFFDLTKQLGCVIIMLGLVWLSKDNLIH